MSTHPPCGLYCTTVALGDLPAGRLVYFHNHGDPGPGLYTPHGWVTNRVEWHERGVPVPGPEYSATLAPLPAEGLYRVREPFHCCEKQCRRFEAEALVQLGYNGSADAIVFVPEWVAGRLAFPEQGTVVARAQLSKLERLTVPESRAPAPAGGLVH